MAKFILFVKDAARQPLPDRMDVHLELAGSLVGAKFDIDGSTPLEFKLEANRPHALRVFPTRHRAVGRFVTVNDGEQNREVTLFAPIHPARIVQVNFPDYADLDPELKEVLRAARIEGILNRGKALYDSLDPQPRAGLLNMFTKMANTPLPSDGSAWSFIATLFRLRPDRIFFVAKEGCRDAFKAAVSAQTFEPANDMLHTPPEGFMRAGSFKSLEAHGNLQASFFAGAGLPPVFKVDADIDEAGGVGHAFEVLRNMVTGGITNPYDVHQILAHHFIAPPYEILTRN